MGSSSSSSSHSLLFIPTFFFFLSCALSLSPTPSGQVNVLPITPNFTASYLRLNSTSGAFLSSPNNSFQARITPTKPDSSSFYFLVIHVPSDTIVWSANRNAPASQSSQLRLTSSGLTLLNDSGRPSWSTPASSSAVSSMQLFESGNLVLLDAANSTVWESFRYPTDVLVSGQRLPLGQSLVSSLSGDDLSEGSYRLTIGTDDATLLWNGMSYWKLSMGNNAFRDTSFPVEYMVMNYTGVYLMAENGQEVVIRVILHDSNDTLANASNFRVARLDHNGAFAVVSYGSNEPEFAGPADRCQIPFICRRLGVCSDGGSCQCAPAFRPDPKASSGGDCVPSDDSVALPVGSPCDSNSSSSAVTYLSLSNDLDYFSNDFKDPEMHNVNLSSCEALCSSNCSCLGVFYSQGSGSCYVIRNFLGSLLMQTSSLDRVGYIKGMAVVGMADGYLENKDPGLSDLTVVLLPSSGVILIALIGALIICARRRNRWKKCKNLKSGRIGSCSSAEEEMDFELIPGLPVRFDYQELTEATRGFGTLIGSGGFGTVYKGTLKDGTTEVAVKKISCLGSQGRREFLTEIAVIGKTHHVNLVRLKGFCTHGEQRLLVYEYIRRGSLDRTLFSGESVLNWTERHEIALGMARGLAYLHSGCEHKILHCDIKPENILLHEKSQVKISDFGLSKLLSPEQSGLFTTLRGTRGYLAPEWLMSAAISDRTDVYSYGMVLLEIIRGQKNSHPQEHYNINRGTVSSSSPQLVYFPLLALEMHEERRYQELVDPRLMGRVTSEQAEKLVRVALCCVQEDPGLRPSMTNVVGMLEGRVALGEPRMESLRFLRFYGRRFTEASTLGGNSEQEDDLMMYRQRTSNAIGSSSASDSLSYMSSQEVSGPR